MRKVKVRHRRLPGVGDLFELDTADGSTVTVISHRAGRHDIAIGETSADQPLATTRLTRSESAAVALLLTGAHVELVPARESQG